MPAVFVTPLATPHLARLLLVLSIGWCLALPLRDVLAYPDRVSVLPNLQVDAATYDLIARRLAATWQIDALEPKHPPGWVTLLAIVYTIAGPSYVTGKLISWIALIVSVFLCAWIARRMYSTAAAWTAAFLCASSPALRGYVGTLQYEVTTGAWLLGTIVLAIRTFEATTTSTIVTRAMLAGAAAAALVLTRESFVIAVPLIALWMALRIRRALDVRHAILAFTIMGLAAAIPVVAWSAVQSVRAGRLITISEKGSMVVELGNNPLANGTYNAPLVGIGQPTGLAFVRENPGRSLVLAGRKTLYFWGGLRDGWNVPRPMAVWLWRATTGLVPLEAFTAMARGGWLLLLFVAAIWMLGRKGLALWWGIPATVLVTLAVHIATLASHRFAVPVLPLVFVLISGPVWLALHRLSLVLRSRVVLAAALILGAIVGAMQFQAWPLSITHRAADLDGLDADNVREPGGLVRFADAKRGERPVVLLSDEYLPHGHLRLEVDVRGATTNAAPGTSAVRIALLPLDGRPNCVRDVPASALQVDRFTRIALSCTLLHDGPATVAIFSLGTSDLAIDEVRLAWEPGG